MRDWTLLLVATLLLIGGGAKAAVDGSLEDLSSALLAAGMVVLGSWVAMEVRKYKDKGNDEPKD